MNDAGSAIQIDIKSATFPELKIADAGHRILLGYVSGEFSEINTYQDLYVKIWFKRGIDMEWESIVYRLNPGQKIFRQKIIDSTSVPFQPSLLVTEFYVQLYGWIESTGELDGAFTMTAFEVSLKHIPIGKFGGKPLNGFAIVPQNRDGSSGS